MKRNFNKFGVFVSLSSVVVLRQKGRSRAGVLNPYSLIYPLTNFKSKVYSPNFFLFSLPQILTAIGKSVNFLLTKVLPRQVKLPPKGKFTSG